MKFANVKLGDVVAYDIGEFRTHLVRGLVDRVTPAQFCCGSVRFRKSDGAMVVPVGFSRDDLEAVAEGLESEPPTVNIGPIEVGDRDTSVESSAAFAARFIRAVLAAPPTPGVQDDVAKDAARYRFISQKICFTGNGDGTCSMHVINLPMRCHGWPEVGQVEAFVDAAIDAAMLAAAPEVPR